MLRTRTTTHHTSIPKANTSFIAYKAFYEDPDGGLHTLHNTHDVYLPGKEYIHYGDLKVGKLGLHFASNPVEPIDSCFSRKARVFKVLITGPYIMNHCGRRMCTNSYMILDVVNGLHIVDNVSHMFIDGYIVPYDKPIPVKALEQLKVYLHQYEYDYSDDHITTIKKIKNQLLM